MYLNLQVSLRMGSDVVWFINADPPTPKIACSLRVDCL